MPDHDNTFVPEREYFSDLDDDTNPDLLAAAVLTEENYSYEYSEETA